MNKEQGNDSQLITLKSYVTGFVLSIALTLTAYTLVTHKALSYRPLLGTLACLAFAQFLTQLYFFLHLGKETRPRWKLVVFGMMLLVVGILVIGSLWIMSNLDGHMEPSPQTINTYMENQAGF